MFSVVPLVTVVFVLLEQNGLVTVVQAIFISGALDLLYSLLLQVAASQLRGRQAKETDLSQVGVHIFT